ncbi:MAG: SDR family NAD(P)-dependent oxidoreductase [Ginsengibacter sp.]
MKRIVFITGATSGIGKACAEKFAQNDDKLIISGRRKERLNELKKELEEKSQCEVLSLPLDVQQKDEVFQIINELPNEWKSVDVLINSAGLALGRDYFDEANLEDWETMMSTNVNGLLYVTRAVLPFMKEKNRGHVINIGSVAGDEMYEKGNVYCASKSAVDAISHTMRVDLLRHHIKVTNVKPGAVETEFSLVRFKGDEEKASKVYDGFVPLSGRDVADAIFYCASLPPNVCINDLTITPVTQADGIYFYKKIGKGEG